ncbi:hypothetical protein SD77_1232 [Bacillus badius]|uniref:Mobile element protein n=1 Tax=Bacillus badius TaxID=1455 RepID=A0ABR5ASC7_BACBA|nr:hypothetical protein SD78_3203 [Bacillus badius]KIL77559.1 hypothetical protein SD77_1232 [Bacillus badius]
MLYKLLIAILYNKKEKYKNKKEASVPFLTHLRRDEEIYPQMILSI